MSQHTSSQIGDLLSGAGLVQRENIEAALSMSATRRQPLGKILIDSGLMTEMELYGTLQAQNLIREHFLQPDLALTMLSRIRETGRSFLENLIESGANIEVIDFGLSLGELFIDAGAINRADLMTAMETSIVSGLPLVRVLILQNSLDEKSAYSGLTAKLLVKEGRIARGEAVGALKLSHMHGDHIEEILEFGGFKKFREQNFVRLGELLVLSELISELDLLGCVEKSMSAAQPLGQVLVDEGILAEQLVQSALRAQKYIEAGTVDALRASQMLRHCARTGQLLEFSLEELASIKPKVLMLEKPQSLAALLEILGLVPLSELEQIELVTRQESDEEKVKEFILNRQILTRECLEAVLYGYELVKSGRIATEQLVFAVHVWLWNRGDFRALITTLGW